MRKLEQEQVVGMAALGIILALIVTGLVFILYGERTILPGQLKPELATLPEEARTGTLDYLRSSHETMLDAYTPGDRLTWNRLRKAKAAARERIRAERMAVLDAMATNASSFDVQR